MTSINMKKLVLKPESKSWLLIPGTTNRTEVIFPSITRPSQSIIPIITRGRQRNSSEIG